MIRQLMPIGRLGEDREIAALVAWLCREEAAFVTGASIEHCREDQAQASTGPCSSEASAR